ncbi:hypothetical protein [Pyxidicoccus sp. MSG2]|uniref:hypothetical protein n=1 Tax=Pyxidicoccus sp. MSG2 TaxID=2996790 RepID=UPI0022700EEE|nr:hypothetical protein [Pyxidicoccus sp. MSG2]MCY1020840.1 hypothetical protein [Pyxidicoccus sp. MSG2]
MLTRLTRLEVDGFRSLRDVVLCPRALEVVLDAEGTATRDLVALFELLRELAEGRLQQHLSRNRVSTRGSVRVELGVHFDQYGVELQCSADGIWRITREELHLLAGVSWCLTDPAKDAPREESMFPTYAARKPEPRAPGSSGDEEGEWLGFVVSETLWNVRQFLRGFRVQSAEDFTEAEGSFLFLEEPSPDLPANALWDRARSARAASSRFQVLLCTPSVTLADTFDREDVVRAETSEAVSCFQPLVPRRDD